MSDCQDHPAYRALLDRKRPAPMGLQAICPVCDGGRLVISGANVWQCHACDGGLVALCEHYGEPTPRGPGPLHWCDGLRAVDRAEREAKAAERWLASWEQRGRAVWDFSAPVYCGAAASFFRDEAALLGWVDGLAPGEVSRRLRPSRLCLYATDPQRLVPESAEDLIQNWMEQFASGDDYDPRENVDGEDVAALQAALDAWAERFAGMDWGYVETDRAVALPDGYAQRLAAESRP